MKTAKKILLLLSNLVPTSRTADGYEYLLISEPTRAVTLDDGSFVLIQTP